MNIHRQIHRGYRFGSVKGVSTAQMEILVQRFASDRETAAGDLGGRTSPLFTELAGIGKVVIKPFRRGGIIRHVNRRTYFGITKTRGRREFELLSRVRELGINAPEPVAYAEKGTVLYRAWLVTRAIPDSRTLVDLCRSDPGRARATAPMVAGQVLRLIANGILHVDLHPGNVLIDDQNRVFLIDFDKARTGLRNRNRIRDWYIRRWKRAIRKYHLPEFMDEGFAAGLTGLL